MCCPQQSCGIMLCCVSATKDLLIMFCERNRKYSCVCSKGLRYRPKPSLNVCKGPEFFNLRYICSFYKNELNMYFYIAYSLSINKIFQGEE